MQYLNSVFFKTIHIPFTVCHNYLKLNLSLALVWLYRSHCERTTFTENNILKFVSCFLLLDCIISSRLCFISVFTCTVNLDVLSRSAPERMDVGQPSSFHRLWQGEDWGNSRNYVTYPSTEHGAIPWSEENSRTNISSNPLDTQVPSVDPDYVTFPDISDESSSGDLALTIRDKLYTANSDEYIDESAITNQNNIHKLWYTHDLSAHRGWQHQWLSTTCRLYEPE